MFKLLSVLLLSGAVLSQRNPNPCEGRTSGWAQDYSTCASYFWCNPQSVALSATPCPDNFGFNDAAQACIQDLSECTECPLDITVPYAVAEPEDTTCLNFKLCLPDADGLLVRDAENVQTCSGAGTRFNRATGLCDLEANAICPGAPPGGETPADEACAAVAPGHTGDIALPGGTCDQFLTCNAGLASVIDPPLSCLPLHFNDVTFVCDTIENVDCGTRPVPVPASGISKQYVPQAPVIYSVHQSFRDKILSRLHLKH